MILLIDAAKQQQSPKPAFTQISGMISKNAVFAYSLKSIGFAPRYFCTYLVKYDGDEKLNLSLISVKVRLRSRSRRLISNAV